MVVAISCLTLLGVIWAGYRWVTIQQTDEVAIPPNTATPEEIVRAYVTALDVHDCEAVRELATDDFEQDAQDWCDDVDGMRLETLRSIDEGGKSGVARVAVKVTVDRRPFDFDVAAIDNPLTWGYDLTRDSADGSWRINSEGVG